SRDIDYVIDAAHDPEIPIFIFACTVAGKVNARNLRPVLLYVTVRITIDCAQHSRPGLLEHKISTRTGGYRFSVHCDDFRNNSRERLCARSRLRRNSARNRRDHNVPGFGLPPGIDDRAAIMANNFAVPHPGLRIDGFTYAAQEAQATQLVLIWPLIAPTNERSNGSRSGIKNADLMAINDAPEAVGLGKVGRAFVHESSRAILQRAIDDVTVASNPADICRTPIGIIFAQVEHPFGGDVCTDRISAGGVYHAFGFPCCAGGVKDIERVFGIEWFRWTLVGSVGHQLVPPLVAPRLHVNGSAGALVHNNVLYCRGRLQGFLNCMKQLDLTSSAIRAVLGDDGICLRIVNAINQRVRREPAKDYSMRRTDSRN